MEREDLLEDPRFESFAARSDHSDTIRGIVGTMLKERTTEEWMRRFDENEVLASPIADFGDWLAESQVQATGIAPRIDQPGMGAIPMPTIPGTAPGATGTPPVSPGIGEHGREILFDLGLGEAQIDALVREGAVALKD